MRGQILCVGWNFLHTLWIFRKCNSLISTIPSGRIHVSIALLRRTLTLANSSICIQCGFAKELALVHFGKERGKALLKRNSPYMATIKNRQI